MRHSFQRWKSEAFVERGKDENLGVVVENPKHFNRHEAQEAHVILHAAANHGASQIGVARQGIADNDQLQIWIDRVPRQLGLHGGKRFNDANEILVRADSPGIQEKRVSDLVTLRDELAISFGSVAAQKALVDGVVDDLNALRWNSKQLFDLFLGELRDGKNAGSTLEHAAGQLKVQRPAKTGVIARAIHMLENVVNRHHIAAGQCPGKPEQMRDMDQIAAQAFHNGAKFEVAFGDSIRFQQRHSGKIGRKRTDFLDFFRRPDQNIFVYTIDPAHGADNIANVSANAELRHAADIDGHSHGDDLITRRRDGHNISNGPRFVPVVTLAGLRTYLRLGAGSALRIKGKRFRQIQDLL